MKRDRSFGLGDLLIPAIDPDMEHPSNKRYLSEVCGNKCRRADSRFNPCAALMQMMSQGLKLRMSIDGSHDSLGSHNSDAMQPSPGSDAPQLNHQTNLPHANFNPGMSSSHHFIPWGNLMMGGPHGGFGGSGATAQERTECQASPATSGACRGPPTGVCGSVGSGSPTDARFSLDLRKTALLRSLLLRTEDAASLSAMMMMPVDDQTLAEVPLPSNGPHATTEGTGTTTPSSRPLWSTSLQVVSSSEGEIGESGGGSMMPSPTGSLTDLSQPGWGLVRNQSLGGLSRGACSMRSQSSLVETGKKQCQTSVLVQNA